MNFFDARQDSTPLDSQSRIRHDAREVNEIGPDSRIAPVFTGSFESFGPPARFPPRELRPFRARGLRAVGGHFWQTAASLLFADCVDLIRTPESSVSTVTTMRFNARGIALDDRTQLSASSARQERNNKAVECE